MENRTGMALAGILMSRLSGTQVEDVYIDEDEEGPYLGLVFSDGETEYHLTFDAAGSVELAEGPLEGENLEEVVAFRIAQVEPPFSEDGATGD